MIPIDAAPLPFTFLFGRGVNGDRDAVPDVSTVAELIEEALAELVAAAGTEPLIPVRRPTRRTD